ncbi:uncharacterized protein YwqG [Bacillus sp. RC251]|uniref:DUF1963 domain-containing protein n=1 Tax=Bacillus sp. RC251 TaxID=3156290 RepID=UPI003838C559
MEIVQIKNILRKKATLFQTGGKRPDLSINESWIGKIPYSLPNETYPIDRYQEKMYAIMMLNLTQILFVPEAVKGTKAIAVFLSPNFAKDLSNLSGNFCIREYDSIEELVPNEMSLTFPALKPFPLIPKLVVDEFPQWDTEDFPNNMQDRILELENTIEIDYYEDIFEENHYIHKLGGYACFAQSGIQWPADYEFIFQITDDPKVHLKIIHGGGIYFAKNSKTNDWIAHCDFL